jgi:uncharacterized membrane protein
MSQIGSESQTPASGDFGIPAEPPAWPKVVGIISIVWGCLGIICNVCSLGSSAVGNALVNMAPPEQREQIKQQMAASHSPLTMGLYVVGTLVAILLIAAGVQTLRRQANGRALHLLWGVLGIVMAVAGGAVGLMNMKTQMANMPQNANAQAAQAQQMGMTFGYVFFACIMVLVVIWPVFVVIWFGPMGKRPEAGAGDQEPLV